MFTVIVYLGIIIHILLSIVRFRLYRKYRRVNIDSVPSGYGAAYHNFSTLSHYASIIIVCIMSFCIIMILIKSQTDEFQVYSAIAAIGFIIGHWYEKILRLIMNM